MRSRQVSEQDWVLFLSLVITFSVFAAWFGRFSVTMPMFLVLVAALVGPDALGWLDIPATAATSELVLELTLAMILFADASTLDLKKVRLDAGLPTRLLSIGLPLTVLLGAAVAYLLFPDEGLGFALLMGAILAPTDAALGLPIFTNPRVPGRIRQALNVESGLNDGLATPLVTLFTALAVHELHSGSNSWFADAISDIGIAVLVGAAGGLVGGWLFLTAVRNAWTTPVAQRIGNLGLALGVYWASLSVGGNGFVAAFVGGLVFGAATHYQLHEATDFTEETGAVLSTLVWTIFGTTLVAQLLRSFDFRAFVFAVLSLTVVRMAPVAVSLIGTRLRRDTVLVMGWLGPRGLASVVFMLISFEALRESEQEVDTLAAMAGWAILLSVVLHAVTAGPLANWYANRLESAPPDAAEFLPSSDLEVHHQRTMHRSFGNHLMQSPSQPGEQTAQTP
jgi:sodium/hydrogen antiporter